MSKYSIKITPDKTRSLWLTFGQARMHIVLSFILLPPPPYLLLLPIFSTLFLMACSLFFIFTRMAFLPRSICLFCLPLSFSPAQTEGRLEVNMTEVSLEEVERSLLEGELSIAPGGHWKPKDCLPRWKVCVGGTLDSSLFDTQVTEKRNITNAEEVSNLLAKVQCCKNKFGSNISEMCIFIITGLNWQFVVNCVVSY